MSAQIHHSLNKLGRISLTLARLNNQVLSRTSVCQSHIVGAQPCAFISTSKKNRETIAPSITTAPVATKKEEEVVKKKYWITQGYSYTSEEEDEIIRNRVMFSSVTLGFVLITFILMYYPDVKHQDWSRREAYMELARREALGLPLVDPNLIPPEQMVLPSEEELGDFEVII